jgi:hypothetical protein
VDIDLSSEPGNEIMRMLGEFRSNQSLANPCQENGHGEQLEKEMRYRQERTCPIMAG